MNLDQLIGIANEAYTDGLIMEHYSMRKKAEEEVLPACEGFKQKPDDARIGDTLAKFIVIELCETFDDEASDVEQLKEAARVMSSAKRELEDVSSAFESAQEDAEAEEYKTQKRISD